VRGRIYRQGGVLVAAVPAVLWVLGVACGEDEVTGSLASVASVKLSPAGATMRVGDRLRITATLLNSQGDTLVPRAIVWSTSNVGVAAVDETGLVTAISEGDATIEATSEGISGSALLSIELEPQPVGFIGYADPAARLTVCGA
jgi:hypothetical protein